MTADPNNPPQPVPQQQQQQQSAAVFAGIDVSKDKLDLATTAGPAAGPPAPAAAVRTFDNSPAGVARLVAHLRPLAPATIAVEATGGYERLAVDALLDAGLPVATVNPRNVRHFARGLGRAAKTDPIDARVLAEFARLAAPRLTEKRARARVELEALVTCRRQLLHVRTEQTNRRQQTTSPAARRSIDAVLKAVNSQIGSLDRQIADLIASDDDLDRLDKILRSVPGVGLVLSATLLSELAELGTLDRRQVSSLAGVAPFNHDSGRLAGKRSIRGGRASVRSVLYMSAVGASHYNPVIKAFADRLKANGKAGKVVIVACMRKLLTILNAMLRDGLTWDQLDLTKLARNP